MVPLRLIVVGTDAPFSAAIRDILAAQLPEAATEMFDAANMKSRPIADGAVIDGRSDAARAADLASRMRAMGFAGVQVVVVPDGSTEFATAFSEAGAAHIPSMELATRLVPALAELLESAGSEHAGQVARARRLIAAGKVAIGFQHSLNNPLAGILAEAQLMQLDPMQPEQHAAVERIIVLCRRIIELGRSLDGMGERK